MLVPVVSGLLFLLQHLLFIVHSCIYCLPVQACIHLRAEWQLLGADIKQWQICTSSMMVNAVVPDIAHVASSGIHLCVRG